MTEYTPTTEEVYEAYASEGDGGIASLPDHSYESFDRWLQSVKADAWDEGHRCAIGYVAAPNMVPEGGYVNPYRKGS